MRGERVGGVRHGAKFERRGKRVREGIQGTGGGGGGGDAIDGGGDAIDVVTDIFSVVTHLFSVVTDSLAPTPSRESTNPRGDILELARRESAGRAVRDARDEGETRRAQTPSERHRGVRVRRDVVESVGAAGTVFVARRERDATTNGVQRERGGDGRGNVAVTRIIRVARGDELASRERGGDRLDERPRASRARRVAPRRLRQSSRRAGRRGPSERLQKNGTSHRATRRRERVVRDEAFLVARANSTRVIHNHRVVGVFGG